MDDTGCSACKNEHLYILKIFVQRVYLFADKYDKLDLRKMGVDINFIDFPLLRIFQADFLYTRLEKMTDMTRDGKYRIINFDAGKIYLFTYNPAILIKKMRETLVSVDVYKVKEIIFCPEDIAKEPLGATQFPLAGCLCDQMTMAGNDYQHLPRVYSIKNTYNLVNKDNKPTGVISLSVTLSCSGDYIGLHFAYIEKTLIFKHVDITAVKSYDNKEEEKDEIVLDEFHCMKVPLFDEEARIADEREKKICMPQTEFEVSELDLPPRPQNVTGLDYICNEVMLNDGLPKTAPNEFKELKDLSVSMLSELEIFPPCLCSPYAHIFIMEDRDKPPVAEPPCNGGLCIGGKLLYTLPANYEYDNEKIKACARRCFKCQSLVRL